MTMAQWLISTRFPIFVFLAGLIFSPYFYDTHLLWLGSISYGYFIVLQVAALASLVLYQKLLNNGVTTTPFIKAIEKTNAYKCFRTNNYICRGFLLVHLMMTAVLAIFSLSLPPTFSLWSFPILFWWWSYMGVALYFMDTWRLILKVWTRYNRENETYSATN